MEGITDLRDESDRRGMRIVIELSKSADPEAILSELYRRTPMQSTFSIILLALVDGEPRLLSLKQALRVYLEHRLTVIRRRSEYDLERARQRAHILEGLLVALDHLDEVIALIRKAPDVEKARTRLRRRFKLSQAQAEAILAMQLRRLAALERKKIKSEHKETLTLIRRLEGLLKSERKMRAVAAEELLKIKEAYGDRRRTQIARVRKGRGKGAALTAGQLLPEQTVWVSVTAQGLISRTVDEKPPRRSGSAAPRHLVRASTRDTLYLVAENGRAAAIAVHTLPEAQKPTEGVPWHSISPLKATDRLATVFALPSRRDLPEETCVMTVSRGGMVKKTLVNELPGPSAHPFTLARVNDGDALGWVLLTDGEKDILLVTAQGMSIRFHEKDVRPMGLVAAGVNGIKLAVGDVVVGAEILPPKGARAALGRVAVFLATSDGKGKRVTPEEFPVQGRYGKGVIAWPLPEGVRLAGMALGKPNTVVTLHLRRAAPKMSRTDAAPLRKRAAARGGAILPLKAGDAVVALTAPWEAEHFLGKKKKIAGKRKTKSARKR